MEDANLHHAWLTAWGRPGLGAQFRLTVPRKAGGILQQSPLPLVPRDIVGLNVRLGGTETPLNGPSPATPPAPSPATPPAPSPATPAPAGPPATAGGPR
jgi:two-component system sensor histidine kinase MtrB